MDYAALTPPLTDRGSQLLDQLQAEAQLYPLRTTQAGARSYALRSDTVQLDGLDAALGRLARARAPRRQRPTP